MVQQTNPAGAGSCAADFIVMSMKIITGSLLLIIVLIMSVNCHAQLTVVKETNTPIALHYANILKEYITFIKPNLNNRNDLIKISKEYFDKLGYRVVTISVETTIPPKILQSWKIPHSKLAVLPRMICHVSKNESTIELYAQGDDYVLIQNYVDQTSIEPGLFISVGLTHRWQ
ncbi:MAG: hypothetical protein A2Y65_02740 [Deltaproteobacteria bacterium RBG_13_52_11]|nr:MAG: hypothetical protein A2Y65_02740 [Deltaproteobacteria bacterium RBG_13_52_11]